MPQYQGVWSVQEAARLQSQQQWVTDPNFKNTTLLLQADTINAATQNNTFLDSSSNAFSITRNGNTTQGTFTPFSQSPGSWSNYFSSAQITTPSSADFAFGSGDFTVECFVNCVVPSSGYNDFVGTAFTNIGTNWFLGTLNGKLVWSSYQTNILNGSTAVPSNQWVHVVVSRVSGTTRFFLDGKLDGSVADSIVYTNVSVCGIGYGGGAYMANGYISNLRIVKGAGVTSVTVPTAPLSPVANTVLLTCQSSSFIDTNTQTTAKTLTVASGAPSVQALSPFAPQYQYDPTVIGGSGYFDGTGDYLTTPTTGQFAPAGNFTIACWFYITSLAAQRHIIGNYAAASAGNWLVEVTTGGALQVFLDGSTLRLSATGIAVNQWYYMTITRTGSTVTGQLNGANFNSTATYTLSGTFGLSNQAIWIGTRNGGTNPMLGYISGIQLVDGSAVTSVPALPPTAISGTNLLLNFTNAGIYDGTLKNNLETVGNAQVSTAVVKYGSGSMYFDGTGDYLKVPSSPNLALGTGDFTVECWVYPTTFVNYSQWVSTRIGDDASYWGIDSNSSGVFYFFTNGIVVSSSAQSLNTWIHIAAVRSSGTFKLYINGVSQGSASLTNNFLIANGLGVGGAASGAQTAYGYIDDLRITKGLARYTANFIPPSVALPRQ